MKAFTFLGFILGVGIFQGCETKQNISRAETCRIVHVWSGAPDVNSIVIGVSSEGADSILIEVSMDSTFASKAAVSEMLSVHTASGYVKSTISRLESGTLYYYRALCGGLITSMTGQFQTLRKGPQSFDFVVGSCMRTGSESDLFRTMASTGPLFFLNTGDYHYQNIKDSCNEKFMGAFQANWNSAAQAELMKKAPFIYMWDDHDYGPNNSGAEAPCREAAVAAYRRFVPHYPQLFSAPDGPISQSFVVGRVRFVLSDLRSQKLDPKYQGCDRIAVGTNFGSEAHLNWFFGELETAKDSGQFVVWVSSMPYINHPGGPNFNCDEDDDWGGFPEERTRIADFIKDLDVPVCILSGDAHMSAIDDGTNSGYATGGGGGVPVFHAGPLHEKPSYKGGPYSHGYSAQPFQFGMVRVIDNGGDEICFEWEVMDIGGNPVSKQTGGTLSLLRYSFCRALPAADDRG